MPHPWILNRKGNWDTVAIFVADLLLLHNWKLKLSIVFAEYRCLEDVSSIPRGWLSRTAGSYVGAVYHGGFRAFRCIVIPALHVFRAFFFFFNGCHCFPLLKNVHLHFETFFWLGSWEVMPLLFFFYRNVTGLLRIVGPRSWAAISYVFTHS